MERNVSEKFYESLYQIRRVEEEVARVYPTDVIKSPIHLSIGQEFVSVGVCQSLRKEDIVYATYRSHAAYLAKGGDLNKMVAELYGKATGCAKGRGGSMHLIDVEQGVMGTSAVVATTIPESIGHAFALKYQRKDNVVVSFFGDGATEEGAFYESLNWASVKKLPIIFVCENNGLAIHTKQDQRQGNLNISEKSLALGVKSKRIDSGDIFELYDDVSSLVSQLRESRDAGPFLYEVMTSRWKEHVGPGEDFHLGYRESKETRDWIENDQLVKVGNLLDPDITRKIEEKIEEDIRVAFEYAVNSPFPDESELLERGF